MALTITRTQYESLLAAARGDSLVNVDQLQDAVDAANSIRRYQLLIRWQEVGGSTARRFSILDGSNWPPSQEFLLIQDRAIAREDVDEVLRTQATNPVDVLVTTDPAGVVGLTELNAYDFIANAG